MANSTRTVKTTDSTLPVGPLRELLIAFVVLASAQWGQTPLWILGVGLALGGWRYLAQIGKVRLPGRWFRVFLLVSLVAAFGLSVGGRFAVDTAAAFFLLVVGFKWLETRTSRDFYVMFFILIYLAAVNFLFHQAIGWALVNFVAVMILFNALWQLNSPGVKRAGWKRLAIMMAKTLPVVILLFLFFPRLSPLWSVPVVSGQARTGISDSMAPGSISSLAQSSARAFRVTFGGPMPDPAERYWRGLALDYFDGTTWRETLGAKGELPGRFDIDSGAGVLEEDEYEVLLDPTGRRWAFALENSTAVDGSLDEVEEDLFRFRRPVESTTRYRLRRDEPSARFLRLSSAEYRHYLQLPREGNPRAREFARQLRQSTQGPEDFIFQILSRFRNQSYFYTLRPPPMPEDAVDRLLFEEKRGFCAHYASATAFLLRSAGIPSRIINGYQGGSPGADDAYLIVRQYDAHAWVEAWIDGRGWVRIDPTAAISPQRIEQGLREAVANEGSFLSDEWMSAQRFQDVALVRWASLQMDRINYQWQRWVVGYQGQTQLDIMSKISSRLGLKELGYVTAALVGGILLILGLISGLRAASGKSQSPEGRLIGRWYSLAREAGIEKPQSQTPNQLAASFARAHPASKESAGNFARLVNHHYYSGESAQGRAGQSRRQNIRQLREALKNLKRTLGRRR